MRLWLRKGTRMVMSLATLPITGPPACVGNREDHDYMHVNRAKDQQIRKTTYTNIAIVARKMGERFWLRRDPVHSTIDTCVKPFGNLRRAFPIPIPRGTILAGCKAVKDDAAGGHYPSARNSDQGMLPSRSAKRRLISSIREGSSTDIVTSSDGTLSSSRDASVMRFARVTSSQLQEWYQRFVP